MKTARFVLTLVVLSAALIALTSCSQSKTVTVPAVMGECPLTAYDILHRAGLRVSTGTLDAEVSMEYPPAGAAVHGGTVTLTFGPATHFGSICGGFIRSGKALVAPDAKAPDLIGKTLDFAYKESAHGVYVMVKKPGTSTFSRRRRIGLLRQLRRHQAVAGSGYAVPADIRQQSSGHHECHRHGRRGELVADSPNQTQLPLAVFAAFDDRKALSPISAGNSPRANDADRTRGSLEVVAAVEYGYEIE